jgi:hypothetical protein
MDFASIDLSQAPPELLDVLARTPAFPPPEGVTSNFVDPPSRARTQLDVSSAVLALVVPFILNRVYVKLVLQKRVTWDDGTVAPNT